MWKSSVEVERNAKINDVIIELHAQLNQAKKWGLDLSHFDSHMGSLYGMETFRLELLAAALAASYEHGLPFRLPYLPNFAPFRHQLGFGVLDNLVFGQRVPDGYENAKRFYIDIIKKLQPGVTELYIHPSIESDEIKHVTNAWNTRVNEMNIFCDEEVRNVIKQENITLISWEPIRKYQREKMNWNSTFRASDVFDRYKRLLGVN